MTLHKAGRFCSAFLFCAGLATGAQAKDAPPHLGPSGLAAYRAYQAAATPKAFAIAPGGGWGWAAETASGDRALDQALAYCQQNTPQRCVPYAVDGRRVFDAQAWSGLWGPYADQKSAARAATGTGRGMRFPDLALTDPRGRKTTLSRLNGQIRVLHFWGSWCGPCRQEMPDIERAARQLKGQVAFILTQVREDRDTAQGWLKQQGIALPLYDSGGQDGRFRLKGGERLADRQVAKAFPTTYVLDRHGLVLFSHVGPIHDWSEYLPFLRHAAAHAR